ncbi:MAG: hypothetical protein NTW87_16615, partial [Planctomycetota bacterium]|nr:hypothetical protein [Planctomycetota bacterium]
MLAVGVIGFGGINSYLPGGGDNAGYIAEAEALLRHGQRLSLYELGSPPATFKAPLFPILLAGVEALFGRNVAAMKALLVLCAMGAVWAAWWALRCGLEEGEAEGRNAGAEAAGAPEEARSFQAAVLALWFALMPILALTCHDVLTDVPFTALTLLVIGCAGRAAWPGAAYRTLIPLVALLVVATFLRSAGVLLGAACVAYLGLEALLRRKEKCFPRLVLGCVVIAALTGGFLWLQQRGPRTYVSLAVQEITAPA